MTCWETKRLFYYVLVSMTLSVLVIFIYLLTIDHYPRILIIFCLSILSCLVVLSLFIVFTKLSEIGLILLFVCVVVFTTFTTYNLRTSVKRNLYDLHEQHPIAGSMLMWIEGLMVFCRVGEIIGKSFHN